MNENNMTQKDYDVEVALQLLLEALNAKRKQFFNTSGVSAMQKCDADAVKAIMQFITEQLDPFIKDADTLKMRWADVMANYDIAAPEVKEAVGETLFPAHTVRKTPGGFTQPGKKLSPKSNFTVRIDGGPVIADKKASIVFAKAIVAFGVEDVAKLGLTCCGELLVPKELSKKYPSCSHPVGGGYYVLTQSNTAWKVDIVKEIAQRLNRKVEVTEIPGKMGRTE